MYYGRYEIKFSLAHEAMLISIRTQSSIATGVVLVNLVSLSSGAALRSAEMLISNSYYLSSISRVRPTIGREVVKAVCEPSLWGDGRSSGKK
ncbi:hypothetical protein CEXT_163951 [Caerostris extrusa]|uniref:Uncharacterized protein n=1 Tax=Caerostris extrusa TaxID=172846 RepID=A0AAV4T054_CAEEX|nr:hypothetical protein CEXT_163951 [Caerostris extrusa]